MIRYLPMYWETTLVDRVEVAFADAMFNEITQSYKVIPDNLI